MARIYDFLNKGYYLKEYFNILHQLKALESSFVKTL